MSEAPRIPAISVEMRCISTTELPALHEPEILQRSNNKRSGQDDSDRSRSSTKGHKPSASLGAVPVLQHLRSFVDTPASHEFCTRGLFA